MDGHNRKTKDGESLSGIRNRYLEISEFNDDKDDDGEGF